ASAISGNTHSAVSVLYKGANIVARKTLLCCEVALVVPLNAPDALVIGACPQGAVPRFVKCNDGTDSARLAGYHPPKGFVFQPRQAVRQAQPYSAGAVLERIEDLSAAEVVRGHISPEFPAGHADKSAPGAE